MTIELDAGEFGTWLVEATAAIRDRSASDVPCGPCTGCCTSSQFVHIEPDELDALAHIPAELLFPAPRLPRGNVLMGYDQRGHCPMLSDGLCTIYVHRPRTCRTYDCRVFPAAGLDVDDETKSAIADQVGRWQFTYGTPSAKRDHEAVIAAGSFVTQHADELSHAGLPATNTHRAVVAVRLHALFVESSHPPDVAEVAVQLRRITRTA